MFYVHHYTLKGTFTLLKSDACSVDLEIEMRRIRKLVDGAYSADPRIARFREEDKQEKAAKKKAKQDAARAR